MNERAAEPDRRPVVALALIFFLSGAAALLFETLWFRLTGLTFGNTAWATAIVLTAFMAGLAAGNAAAARFRSSQSPLRVYASLEMAIAVSALVLVLILPATQRLFAPLFSSIASEWMLEAARLFLAFILLVIPTTLMGATLPTAVGALSTSEDDFGRVLGLLYGMNTLGAVAGSLAGELVLIRLFGVRGTGVIAAACSAAASAAAFVVARSARAAVVRRPAPGSFRWSLRLLRLLAAAAGAGFALLALEVVWFRFLILFNFSSSLAFTAMLAVVLLGIGAGALAASILLRSRPDSDRFCSPVASAAGVAMIVCYWGFTPSFLWKANAAAQTSSVVIDALRLMLPVSVLSGFFFTVIGKSIEREVGDDTAAAALLTCCNTVGAAVGSVVAGFLLVPRIGVERSFFLMAIAYAAVAVLSMPRDRGALKPALGSAAVLFLGILLFPRGIFRATFVPEAVRTYLDPSTSVAAVREGILETAVLLRTDVAGEPYMYRLFTNGYSMSGTNFGSKRYMSLFVHLPVALQPAARTALLISYGVGTTATALIEQPQLTSIDVVDPSRNILDLSSIIHPGDENPLRDRRVRTHVEDGRFFLLTTRRHFDLITAEPPPPKSAGIVSLYTLEYFRLLRDRLTDQGVATYWLPVYQLDAAEAKAVVSAFCGAFQDCSLWSGAGGEWILAGSRGGLTAPSESAFANQWTGRAGTRLRWIGVEKPAQLAATFLADAAGLRGFTKGADPLTDDRPLLLSPETISTFAPEFDELMRGAPQAFASSQFALRTLPPGIRAAAPQFFAAQSLVDTKMMRGGLPKPQTLASMLTTTDLHVVPRILLGSDMWLESIVSRAAARGDQRPTTSAITGIGALADRRYRDAERLLGSAADGGFSSAAPYAILSAFLAGDTEAARHRLTTLPPASPWRDEKEWRWAAH